MDKKKYSVRIKVTDNLTGKHSDIYMDSDEPKKLGLSAGNFIEASCMLVNMGDEELKEVQQMIIDKLEKK